MLQEHKPRQAAPLRVIQSLCYRITSSTAAFADGAARALEDKRVRLLKLEAVRGLVGADEPDQREVVELERAARRETAEVPQNHGPFIGSGASALDE